MLCGVPQEYCTGGTLNTDQRLGTTKSHGSHEQAFKCMRHYLMEVLGYTQAGSREFRPPDGGPVRVLTKKIRFGGNLRAGKGDRFMPDGRDVGHRGIIISK